MAKRIVSFKPQPLFDHPVGRGHVRSFTVMDEDVNKINDLCGMLTSCFKLELAKEAVYAIIDAKVNSVKIVFTDKSNISFNNGMLIIPE